MKRVLILLLLGLVACAPQDDNPLIAASDDQFVKAIGNLPFLGCENALFGRDAGPGSETQRESCERGLQKRAADAGIPKSRDAPRTSRTLGCKARYEKLSSGNDADAELCRRHLAARGHHVKSYTVSAWSDVAAANASSLRLMLILYVALFGMLVWYGALRLSMAPDRQAPAHGNDGLRARHELGCVCHALL